MTTRDFHPGTVLSVTTGRLLSPDGIGGLYEILNWMTGDNLFTHQLPRASDECAPSLRAQFPDLAAVVPPEFSGEAEVWTWLAAQVEAHGETREVAPLREDEHTYVDPITELHKMAPGKPVIGVIVPDAAS